MIDEGLEGQKFLLESKRVTGEDLTWARWICYVYTLAFRFVMKLSTSKIGENDDLLHSMDCQVVQIDQEFWVTAYHSSWVLTI